MAFNLLLHNESEQQLFNAQTEISRTTQDDDLKRITRTYLLKHFNMCCAFIKHFIFKVVIMCGTLQTVE